MANFTSCAAFVAASKACVDAFDAFAHKHTLVTTEHFKNNLEFFSGLDLTDEFETYIWGEHTSSSDVGPVQNPVHLPLTDAQLKALL